MIHRGLLGRTRVAGNSIEAIICSKARAKVDRYFEAFEAGAMKPDFCNQKVKDLTATVEALEVERRELAARKARLTIPPVDKEMLSGILSEFEETMANGTNPQKSTFSAGW
jgi:hypothetical protein